MYYNFIHDVDELRYFYENILPPLEITDVYFVSLSARKKYLTDEERILYDLGRTEMFCKNIIRQRDWNRFLRTIRKFECHKEGYTSRTGIPIPEKAIVCYININPSNTLRALAEFKKVLAEYEVEIASIALSGRTNTNIAYRLNKLDNSLMTAYQQSRGKKTWMDIDLDVPKDFLIHDNEEVKAYLAANGIKTYYWIDTKSGYHLLIKKDELKFNPNKIIEYIKYGHLVKYYVDKYSIDQNDTAKMNSVVAKAVEEDCEVVINKNEMIPLPGTLQGGYPVRILNKTT